jgi:MOSC domain-containing protein YiiM
MTVTATVASLRVGRVAPLGPDGVPSGFVKHAVEGPVTVAMLGLDGDQQADLTVHGGPDKAVYGYAAAHYPAWRTELPRHADRFEAGSMGENLTIAGLDESGICVGDVHAIGSALLQACQPRQPCFKLALHFGDKRMPKAFVKSGRAGWYYRVLRAGAVRSGDAVVLHDRPNPDFAFSRLTEIVYHGGAAPSELKRMAVMTGIAGQWRAMARQLLS